MSSFLIAVAIAVAMVIASLLTQLADGTVQNCWAWTAAAKLAPLITAGVAVLAFCSAVYGIRSQRSIARKRAALDLFFKTELDNSMVETYGQFNKAVDSFGADTKMEDFCKTKEYDKMRSVLNIHELVAVGVHKDILDEDVCFDFWSDELMDAYRNCKRIIEHARQPPKGTRFTYADLERLNEKWVKRANDQR